MLLQATLNGALSKADHPAVPVSLEELAEDALSCVAAGARAFHVHPRDEAGAERLDAATVDKVVAAVRHGHGQPVGVTTGAWIEPDVARRAALVSEWTEPDYATVNLSEDGSLEIIQVLLQAGIGVEAGVWTVADAELLVSSGLADYLLRICIEPVEVSHANALGLVSAIHHVLDAARAAPPRLQHGDGEATWVLIEDAIARGIDTRVGLEDTLLMPDRSLAASNADLVRAAYHLGAGQPAS
jgi:uncharacterized protein (DUF849 family)